MSSCQVLYQRVYQKLLNRDKSNSQQCDLQIKTEGRLGNSSLGKEPPGYTRQGIHFNTSHLNRIWGSPWEVTERDRLTPPLFITGSWAAQSCAPLLRQSGDCGVNWRWRHSPCEAYVLYSIWVDSVALSHLILGCGSQNQQQGIQKSECSCEAGSREGNIWGPPRTATAEWNRRGHVHWAPMTPPAHFQGCRVLSSPLYGEGPRN